MDSKSNPTSPYENATTENEVSDIDAIKAESQHLTGAKLYSVFLAVSIAGFLVSLDIAVLATAIPSITSYFHTTDDIGWYGAAYPLSVCALQPISGKLASIFSLRWVFQAFFGTFLLGSILCGAATSSNIFIVGRAIAGIGGAGLSTGAISITTIVSPPKQRGMLIGIMMSLFSVGLVLGPVIGGALTENVSWRWCFYMNLPPGAVTIGILLAFLHPPRKTHTEPVSLGNRIQQLDLFGCLLFASSMIMLFLAMQWGGGQYPWKSATIIGLFVGFGITVSLFVVWEKRQGDQAMIPFSLLRVRSLSLGILFTAFLGGAAVVPIYYLPEWFQIIKGVSPTQSGVRMLPFVGTQLLAMMVVGGSSPKIKYLNPFMLAGSAILCVAAGLCTTLTTFSTSASRWITFPLIQGLGTGFSFSIPMTLIPVILRDKPANIPLAISLNLFANFFGNSVFQTIAASIFKNKLVENLESSAELDSVQINQLLDAGNRGVRDAVNRGFPDKLHMVLNAYNGTISKIFYLELAGAALAFFVCFGIEWFDAREKNAPKAAESLAGEAEALPENIESKV